MRLFLFLALMSCQVAAGATFGVHNLSGSPVVADLDGVGFTLDDGQAVTVYGETLDFPGRVEVTFDDSGGYVVSSVLLFASSEVVSHDVEPAESDLRRVETGLLIVVGLLLFRIVSTVVRI